MGHIRKDIIALLILILSLGYITICPDKATASLRCSYSVMLSQCSDEVTSRILKPEKHEDVPGFKSKTRARLYSAISTTVPVALARLNARGFRPSEQSGTSILLFASGSIVGPSAGSIYADDWDLAKRSILIRSFNAAILTSGHYMKRNEDLESLGSGLMLSGAAFLIGHALYDIFFLSAHSVEYSNAMIKIQAGLSFHEFPLQKKESFANAFSGNRISPVSNLGISVYF